MTPEEPRPSVLRPRTSEEAAALLARAAERGVRVTLGGRGSVRPGLPDPGAEAILTTEAMGSVRHYEPADLTLTADAGISLAELARVTGGRGQFLPANPPGVLSRSLGGVVAQGVSGSLAPMYGRIRDLVLGLTLVTGSGKILRVGGRVVKNVAGFDLVRLAVGSHGILGLITEVSVRLYPRPVVERVLVLEGEAEVILPAARAAVAAPFALAGVQVRDSWEGMGGRPGLAVVLHGNAQSVPAMEEGLRERVPGLAPPPGDAASVLLREMETVADLPVRLALHGLPSETGATLGLARELAASVSPAASIQADPQTGEVHVSLPDPGREGEDRLAGAILEARDRGSGIVLQRGTPGLFTRVAPLAPRDPIHRELEAGVRRVFDPEGILRSPMRDGAVAGGGVHGAP